MFVTDPAQVDGVRRGVLLDLRRRRDPAGVDPEDAPTAAAPTERQAGVASAALARRRRDAGISSSAPGQATRRPTEVEIPLAMASDEELLGARSFDALEPHELAQLYELMSRLQLATPTRRTRRYERGRHGRAHRHAANAARAACARR